MIITGCLIPVRSRIFALLFIIVFLSSLVNLQIVLAQASNTSSAPDTLWRQNYGEDYSALWDMQSLTNLIETRMVDLPFRL